MNPQISNFSLKKTRIYSVVLKFSRFSMVAYPLVLMLASPLAGHGASRREGRDVDEEVKDIASYMCLISYLFI